MNTSIKARIETVLAGMMAPGDTKPLPQAGRIAALIVEDTTANLVLDFGTLQSDRLEEFREAVENAVAAVDGVTAAHVVATKARPAGTAPGKAQPEMSAPKPPTPKSIPGVRHIIAVASGKGGVGKSTTSINLALALRDMGLRVGLLDADIFGPSLPHLLATHTRPAARDNKIQPIETMGLVTMSIGYLIDVNEPVVWRGPRVMGAVQQLLHEVHWSASGDLDCLVVDMPPGTGDVQLTMVQQAQLSGAIIVSTPQDLALIDARKGIAMFEKTNVPIIGLLENMSQFVCPNCGHQSAIFDHGGTRAAAAELNMPFIGEIPLDMAVRQGSDTGKPVVAFAPENPASEAYRTAAAAVTEFLKL